MRLLKFDNNGRLCITKHDSEPIPKYAVLSHTWGADEDEVSLADIENGRAEHKAGYAKVRGCGEQAQKDGITYFWVDTCCIDQKSSNEVSEAINSMFKWYKEAAKCYVYLSDVGNKKRDSDGCSTLRKSRWFTRGWTLQELIAPHDVTFYTNDWKYLGTKTTLAFELQSITQLPLTALNGSSLDELRLEDRLHWGDSRKTKKPEDKAYCLLGIVGVHMPILYGEGENKAFVRLKDEISRESRRKLDEPVHRDGVPWDGQQETQDIRISTTVESRSDAELRISLLRSLAFEQMAARQATIERAQRSTCRWFLEHPLYTAWTTSDTQDSDFLWVTGKPGAGKSTLMRFASESFIQDRSEDETIVSFFFNARGGELERSTVGMYRSILYQILDQLPRLPKQILRRRLAPGQAWTVNLLKGLFITVIQNFKARHLRCFIDALDECEVGQAQEMVVFLEELVELARKSSSRLCICFASRHYPVIIIQHGSELVLQDTDGQKQDIVNYIERNLRAGKSRIPDDIRPTIFTMAKGSFMWVVLVVKMLNDECRFGRIRTLRDKLKQLPTELNDLYKYIITQDTENMDSFLLCLQMILFAKRPLHDREFYHVMECSGSGEQVAIWDPETITDEVMNRFVVSASKGLAELTISEIPTVQFIHESVRDFLLKSDGLAHLLPDVTTDMYTHGHERLKLHCNSYLHSCAHTIRTNESIIDELKDANHREAGFIISSRFPFLRYATDHLLYHADSIACNSSQETTGPWFTLDVWSWFHNLICKYEEDCYTLNVTLLYVLAERGCANLVRQTAVPTSTFSHRDQRFGFPILAAMANGHYGAVQAILEKVNINFSRDQVMLWRYRWPSEASIWDSPLTWAIASGYKDLAELLISNVYSSHENQELPMYSPSELQHRENVSLIPGRMEFLPVIQDQDMSVIRHRHTDGRTSLHYAALRGFIGIVESLLSMHTAVDAIDHTGATALHFAAANGHTDTMRLLLDSGANVDAELKLNKTHVNFFYHAGFEQTELPFISDGCTALHLASFGGHTSSVKLLIERGAVIENYMQRISIQYWPRVDIDSELQGTAIHIAAINGHEEIVALFLDQRIDVNQHCLPCGTVLGCAIEGCHTGTVDLLLNRGARAEYSLGWNGIPLIHRAIYKKSAEIVRLLLVHGARADSLDRRGISTLHEACVRNAVDIVQHLIDFGCEINTVRFRGLTALEYAVRYGQIEMIEFLLHSGADGEAVDSHGCTILHRISFGRWDPGMDEGLFIGDDDYARKISNLADRPACVAALIRGGANLQAVDKFGMTALHHLFKYEYGFHDSLRERVPIARMLLEFGFNAHARDNQGSTAFEVAARNGYPPGIRRLCNPEVAMTDEELKNKCLELELDWLRKLVIDDLEKQRSIDSNRMGDHISETS